MPTPPRTSLERIVLAGRAILDADGVEALTMQRVAAAVGVRAPSLYKHVRDRDALVRLIVADVVAELGAELADATSSGDARADLRAMAVRFRAWALAHPGAYALLFSPLPDAWRVEPDPGDATLRPLFRTVAALAGPDDVLVASRTLVAWLNGFIGMELAGAFRLGGDVDEAFEYGTDRMIAAISASRA